MYILSPLRSGEVRINKKSTDVIFLCTRGIIPRAHHRFYLLLPFDMGDSKVDHVSDNLYCNGICLTIGSNYTVF